MIHDGHKQVLVVDATPEIDSAVESVLPGHGWQIRRTDSNVSAFQLAKAEPFELVITGPRTTAQEDLELLGIVRRFNPDVRFIIVTEQSTPADVISSIRDQAFSFFSTPISPEIFEHMVRNAIQDGWEDGVKVVSATPEWICLLVRCDLKSADRLLQFLREIASLPVQEQQVVGLAFRELLMNAIEHGGHFDPKQYVEISYIRARSMVMCRVKDPGEGFTMEEIEHAAFANPDADPIRHIHIREERGLRPGGFGVMMARNLVDELIYSEKGNDVILVRYLPKDRDRGENAVERESLKTTGQLT